MADTNNLLAQLDETLQLDLTFVQNSGQNLEDMSLLMNLETDDAKHNPIKGKPQNAPFTEDFERELPVADSWKPRPTDGAFLTPDAGVAGEQVKQTDSSKNSRRYHLINQSTRSKEGDLSIPRKARPNSVLPAKKESKQFGSDVDRKKNFIDDSKGADSSGLKLGSAKVSNLRLEDASGQGLNTSSKSKRPALLGSPEGKADMPLKQPATPTASPSKPAFRRNRMLVGNTIKQKPRNPSVGPASAPSAPVYFNLLCLGKDGVGKSSFLKDFIEKVFDKKQVVDRFEKKLVEYVTERKWIDGKRRFVVNLIDSQGYCDEYLVDRWMDDTKKYVYKKMEAYRELKASASSSTEKKDHHVVDPRIHLCLYFVDSESRLNVKDITALQKLKKVMNIIPVMVCEDPEVDPEDVEAYKDRLNKDARDYQIEWLNLMHEVPQLTKLLEEKNISPISPVPPFWYQRVRDEDTDTDVLEDFSLLTELLSGPLVPSLIEKTDIIYGLNAKKLEKVKDEEDEKTKNQVINISMGMAIGVGTLGFFMAIKNKIF